MTNSCPDRGVLLTTLTAAAALAGATLPAQDAFRDYGVGAKVAECRGAVTTRTATGHCLVLGLPLDESKVGSILVTDIDSGVTTQVFCPPDVPHAAPFGSLLHSNGRFYTTQGGIFLEFDPVRLQWTFHAQASPLGNAYIGFTEAPDGKVWAGSVYQAGLISFAPDTRELVDHGRMDPEEKYLNTLAVDDRGWVYCGIGTARANIIAYHPETGEKRQIVPEDRRGHGSGSVHPTADGAAQGSVAGTRHRLYNGEGTVLEDKADPPPRRQVYSIGWSAKTGTFPDGRRLLRYDLPGRSLTIQDPGSGTAKRIEFDYATEGVPITSIGAGPGGVVYGSTCHPMHLLAFDATDRNLRDLGPIPQIGGGNFCAIARQGNIVIGAQYSAGALWLYDVTKPWRPTGGREVFGLTAAQLAANGTCKDGHFTYLQSHDVAFLCGEAFGAEGTFALEAPEDGHYYLHILPYQSGKYCRVQFLLDGEPLGAPYVATHPETRVGELLVHGPLALEAGEHHLTLRALETEGQEPWCAVVAVDLSREKRPALVVDAPANPRVAASWKRDICRPRTALAHPDGRHVLMAGYAGYGLCGGGIGIYHLETGKAELLTADEDLLPGHSCITLQALPNGDLVGGTCIAAPGGGHSTATEAELFILDWSTRKLAFHTSIGSRITSIISILVAGDGLVYGLAGDSTFFVFDPGPRKMVHTESMRAYGRPVRHALQAAPDGTLSALFTQSIVRITPGTFAHSKLASPPTPVTAGGALVNGLLCYASGSHVWTYALP